MNNERYPSILSHAAFAAIWIASCLLMLGLVTDGHDWGGDFSAYIMQARCILEGTCDDFISENRFTVENTGPGLGPVAYPWGFPLLLAPLYKLFGFDITALKAIGLISYALFIAVLYVGFSRVHSRAWNIVFVAFFAFSMAVIRFTDSVMSDIPFLLFSTLAIVLIGHVVVGRRSIVSPRWDHALIGATIVIALLIRSNGIVLLGALAMSQLISSLLTRSGGNLTETVTLSGIDKARATSLRARFPVWAVPYAVVLVVVLAERSMLPAGGDSYFGLLGNVTWASVYDNALYNRDLLRDYSVSQLHYPAYLWVVHFVLLSIGVIVAWRTNYHALIYMLLVFLLYCIWPYRQGLRFLFPLLPFYVSFALIGLEALARWVGKAMGNNIACYLVILALGASISLNALAMFRAASANATDHRPISDGPFQKDALAMFAYVGAHTDADDVIVFRKPRVMRLMTGRTSYRTRSAEYLFKGDYLVVDLKYDREWFDKLKRDDGFPPAPIYENSGFQVMKLNNGVTAADSLVRPP